MVLLHILILSGTLTLSGRYFDALCIRAGTFTNIPFLYNAVFAMAIIMPVLASLTIDY